MLSLIRAWRSGKFCARPESDSDRAIRRAASAVIEGLEYRWLLNGDVSTLDDDEGPPAAAVFVNSTADNTTPDDGFTTLREAVATVNADPTIDAIAFDPSLAGQTITLSTIGDGTAGPSALAITSTVRIDGLTGNNGVTISGGGSTSNLRAFYVSSAGSLTLENLTIQNFRHKGGDAVGGGGAAGFGGAVFVNGGTLNVISSTFVGNIAQGGSSSANSAATGGGGGLGQDGTGTTAGGPNGGPITDGDTAGFGGGGAADTIGENGGFGGGGGSGIVAGNGGFGGGGGASTISQNGTGGFGGGDGSAFGPNLTGGGGAGMGGAIFQNGGTATIVNSTFTRNDAIGGTGASDGLGYGGAVFNRDGNLRIANSTLVKNTVGVDGLGDGLQVYGLGDGSHAGGDPISSSTATTVVNNSILGQSTVSATAAVPADIASLNINGGTGTASGSNNSIQFPISFTATNPVTGDPKLGPLQNNGGPTKTIALLPGSAAINAGNNALAKDRDNLSLPTDQRGNVTRFSKTTVDVGAFEYQFNESLVVTTTADEDDGNADPGFGAGTSLREAIAYAKAKAGDDTITFSPTAFPDGTPKTITLANALGEILIDGTSTNGAITIDGTGAVNITVHAAASSRVFGIVNGAKLTVDGVTVTGGSTADNGGGFYVDSSTLTLTGVVLTGNKAGFAAPGDAVIFGGGIYSKDSTLTIADSTVSDNSVYQFSFGGGLCVEGGTAVIVRSLFDSNTAPVDGGAIENSGTLTVINSTFSGNKAGVVGGAIDNSNGDVLLTNVTIAGNTASGGSSGAGGGLFLQPGGGFVLNNTLLANNTGGDYGGDTDELSGSHNFIADAASDTDVLTALPDTLTGDPKLGSLAENGGLTKTFALSTASPAINAGSNALALDAADAPLTTDQRGGSFGRKVSGVTDIGAFENQTVASVIVTPTSGLTTTEAGGTAQFNVKLSVRPTSSVTVSLSSSDTSEGAVQASVVLDATNYATGVDVTVTGANDPDDDGDVAYSIVTAAATSTDAAYSGLNPADVSLTNTDDDSAPVSDFTQIIDNADATGVTFTGSWTLSSYDSNKYGSNYRHNGNTGRGSKQVVFKPTLPSDGQYEVFAFWAASSNRSSKTPFVVETATGPKTITMDQRKNGGVFVSLGVYTLDVDTATLTIKTNNTDGFVVADAVKFVKYPPSGTPTVDPIIVDDQAAKLTGSWTKSTFDQGFYGPGYRHDGNAGKGSKTATFEGLIPQAGLYVVYARWTSSSNRATNVPYQITYGNNQTKTVLVNQRVGGGDWVAIDLGLQFNAGAATIKVSAGGTNGFVVIDAVKWELAT